MTALTEQIITYHPPQLAGEDAASRMTALVNAIVGRLDRAGVPWCLLRNRDLVPEGLLLWSDLDVMVPTTVPRQRLIELMHDLEPAQIVPFRDGLTYMFFPFDDFFLRVDFFHGEDGWMGAHFTDTEAILSQRRDDEGLMVASPLHQAYLTWCNRLVRGGSLPERYHTLILEALDEQPDVIHRLFADTVGPDLAARLLGMAMDGRLEETSELAGPYKRQLWRHALRRHPFRTAISTARTVAYGLARRSRPSGLQIAIVSAGPGTATRLLDTLATAPSRCVPGRGVIPVREEDDGEVTVTGLVRAWKQHLIGDRGMLARMEFLMHDAHPLEAGVTGSARERVLASRFPAPDLLILLDAPVASLFRELPGLSGDEATRRRERYLALAMRTRNGHVVDADQPVDGMMRDTVALIREATTTRTRRRFGDRPSRQNREV